jgi:hypothetical protein
VWLIAFADGHCDIETVSDARPRSASRRRCGPDLFESGSVLVGGG